MTKKQDWRWVLPVVAALWTLFIWSRSLMSAAASSAESGRIVQWLMGLLGMETRPEWLTYAVRKTAHFVEFSVLGVLWHATARTYGRWRLWLWGLLTGVVDECLQFFAPGRAPMVLDVVIDTAGYLCGAAVIWFFVHLRRKKIK